MVLFGKGLPFQSFVKEKEESTAKKRMKEEGIEKDGRLSGLDAEKILKERAAQPDLSLR